MCLIPSLSTEVTLSALNAPEGDVDIEGLSESGANKKLDFDSDNQQQKSRRNYKLIKVRT
ncbi:chromatin complexes subunit BAP18-like [Elysia marginata]|uniref:Chromatin complexes subunit BAP18-like n=1 Tax=Elysia marginata TaxID=1093978 RepID=A0AAV4J1F1_9GAST|nr:chromatin complexes subunit BAP18-like [Elysia marginata]